MNRVGTGKARGVCESLVSHTGSIGVNHPRTQQNPGRMPDVAQEAVYQLRVVLAGVSPMVWRRLLVTAETSIADLHEILQAAFAWSDEALHRFTIHGVEYGLWREGTPGFSTDARAVRLSRFGLRVGERFTSEYDFFAGWRLDLRVEKAGHCSARHRYPVCTGGARQAPPESCRSVREFLELRRRWPLVIVGARMAEILTPVLEGDPDRPVGQYLAAHREEMEALVELSRLDEFDKAALNDQLSALDLAPASEEEVS